MADNAAGLLDGGVMDVDVAARQVWDNIQRNGVGCVVRLADSIWSEWRRGQVARQSQSSRADWRLRDGQFLLEWFRMFHIGVATGYTHCGHNGPLSEH